MLKIRKSVKELENRAADALQSVLENIPTLKLKTLTVESSGSDGGADIIASVNVSGQPHLLVCQVKQNGQPRYVREAVYQLRSYIEDLGKPATPVLIASYLSPASRELCVDSNISFLDLEGNARIAFDTIFIERVLSSKPEPERREFKSLFRPKSAQVLRILLRDPKRVWKVADLAKAAKVSLGHVSNVRTALLEREWATLVPAGMRLTEPDSLLDAWKSSYRPPVDQEQRFYTVLHGRVLEDAIREMFSSLPLKVDVALCSFSAAQWIAPFARTGTQYLYAETEALEHIKLKLQLSSSSKGENIVVSFPKDDGIFLDAFEAAPGIRCTSAVQTYLDLSVSGERGAEAAEHLRQTRLQWQS